MAATSVVCRLQAGVRAAMREFLIMAWHACRLSYQRIARSLPFAGNVTKRSVSAVFANGLTFDEGRAKYMQSHGNEDEGCVEVTGWTDSSGSLQPDGPSRVSLKEVARRCNVSVEEVRRQLESSMRITVSFVGVATHDELPASPKSHAFCFWPGIRRPVTLDCLTFCELPHEVFVIILPDVCGPSRNGIKLTKAAK